MSGTSSIRNSAVIYAALLIAGICIGISYFSIPVFTGIAGFIPSVIALIVVWAFTLCIGLLYAEAILSQPDGANLFSLTRNLIGKRWATLLGFIFFFSISIYLTCYLYYAARSMDWLLSSALNFSFPFYWIVLIVLLLLGSIVFFGTSFALRINFLLMIGLVFSLLVTLYQGKSLISPLLLSYQHWVYLFFSVPILFSSFGYVALLPPLCTYLGRNVKKIRLAIWIGTLIPLLIYFLWEGFLLGAISTSDFWMLYEQASKVDKIFFLFNFFPHYSSLFNFILLFAMTTSLIGNGVTFVEFLCDAFKISLEKRKGEPRLLICLLAFLPPLFGALFLNHFSLITLHRFTAPLAEVLINGIIPIWLAIQIRYLHKLSSPSLLAGGKKILALLAMGIFFLIYLEGIAFIKI